MPASAAEVVARAGSGDDVIGWKLDRVQRRELLQQFLPKFRNTIADHVTLVVNAVHDAPLPQETEGEIIGRVEDSAGVEAMIVAIGGTTDRPGGGTFHLTWSLADGRKAKESNDAIAECGWVAFDAPTSVRLHPARFR
jgi:hypothetical protein